MSSVAPPNRNLSGRSLSDLSEEISEEVYRDGTTKLDLSNNRLSTLSPSISRLFSNLISLDISSNRLTEFPLELCSLHRLQVLHAKHNRVKSLPGGFQKLVGLRELNLGGNGFEQFPLQLCGLRGLEYLHLGSNHIRCITPHIRGLKG
jgi:Leucine-rich repeat (LRR) protein